MIGQFRVDKNEARKFYRHNIKIGLAIFISIWIFFIGAMISDSGISENIGPILGISIFTLISIAIILNSNNSGPFDSIIITLEEEKIIRTGNGFNKAVINFSDVGKIIFKGNGISIVTKGHLSAYYMSKYASTKNEHIIFIPSMIRNYPMIKEYLIKLNNEIKHAANNRL